jgi:hypothetical protein
MSNARIYRIRLANGETWLVAGEYSQEAEEAFITKTGRKNEVTTITPLDKVVKE